MCGCLKNCGTCVRVEVVDNQTCMSEMMEMMTNQSIDTDAHRSELDKRISTVESKLEFLSVSCPGCPD